eukprot:TRINITY_DN3405_c0_g1_i3.p1 TRINITY_DN3405_c0_g1~~TRINITY_DN3405_c0_g1_i3.p1  ORF type:complete len:697 (-),score=169.33 TRINITY_DN3405_c0_g1_i3:36-1937(-)
MTSANVYLALFAGITVGVSIPGAILSMAILRRFNSNILEINAVQVGASAGSSIVAGIVYTIPAIVINGGDIDWWYTTGVAILGGILGVFFVVPLRRALVLESNLKYPEGVATAEVLRVSEVSEDQATQLGIIGAGALIGFIVKLCQGGFSLWSTSFGYGWVVGGAYLFYIGANCSPALISVGYIIGLPTAAVLFAGGVINWWIMIPIVYAKEGPGNAGPDVIDIAENIWVSHTRYAGVGAMLIGGLSAIVGLIPSSYQSLKKAVQIYRKIQLEGITAVKRTQRDIPIHFLLYGLLFLTIPIFLVCFFFLYPRAGVGVCIGIAALMTGLVAFMGMLFSSVGAFMTGMVGSSNNPVSGMTLATVVLVSLTFLAILGKEGSMGFNATILVGAFVCCAAAAAGDVMQDMKTSHLIGATPWKLQVVRIVGFTLPSLVIAPVIDVLKDTYGIGDPTPLHPSPLLAPQATLMASVTKAIFAGKLPLDFVGIGMLVAIGIVIIDLVLQRCRVHFRVPVLAAALGFYLPFELSSTVFLGGLVVHLAHMTLARSGAAGRTIEINERNGLLFASGLITGESLVGIIVAIPAYVTRTRAPLSFFGDYSHVMWPGMVMLLIAMATLYTIVVVKAYYDERNSFYGQI